MVEPNRDSLEMMEDPKAHNFDQRHDGPFDRPSVNVRRRSMEDGATNPFRSDGFQSAVTSPVGRKSMQVGRAAHGSMSRPTHGSMSRLAHGSMSRRGRPSEDFDIRRDGPYGRPSLTMTRRKSSGTPFPQSPQSPEGRPSLPTILGAHEGDGEEKLKHDTPSEEPPDSIDTFQSSDAAFQPEPPPLNYSLHPRKKSIAIFWTFMVIDCIVAPIALYFGLWYGTSLTPNAVFSIVTAALGGVSILEYVSRFWRLWKKDSTCRVIGAKRKYLDWFHWNFSVGWIFIMAELIIGTIPENPPIRLLAMPVTSMMFVFGTELLIADILRYFQVPSPIRISSVPKGSQIRPCIYSIIEDVIAVDGSGGTTFRENLNKRYEASHIFRAMLRRLGIFWAVGAECMAVLLTILIFTVQHEAAYCLGWAVPFIWGGIWTLITVWYVKRMLREEQKQWSLEVAAKSAA